MDDQHYTQNVKKVKCARCNQIIEYGVPNCPCCGVKFLYPSRPAQTEYVSPPKRDYASKESFGKKSVHWYDLLPRIVIVLCAVVLLVSLFLPYLAMTEKAKWALSILDAFSEGLGYEDELSEAIFGSSSSLEDMEYFSLLEHAIFVNSDSVDMEGGGVYVFLFVVIAILSAWILLCGIFSARLWAAIGAFAGNAWLLVVFCIQNWDFTEREMVPDAYRWSVSFYLILISLIFIFFLAAWQIFVHSSVWKKYLGRPATENSGVDASYNSSRSWGTHSAERTFDSWNGRQVNANIQMEKRTVENPPKQIKREDDISARSALDPWNAQRMNTDSQVKKNNTEGAHRSLPKDEEDVTIARIKQYKKMLDDGFITEEEYQAKKRKLLDI